MAPSTTNNQHTIISKLPPKPTSKSTTAPPKTAVSLLLCRGLRQVRRKPPPLLTPFNPNRTRPDRRRAGLPRSRLRLHLPP
ncbi:hypothetical protein ACFX15_018391 [Malus domestica]